MAIKVALELTEMAIKVALELTEMALMRRGWVQTTLHNDPSPRDM